MSVNRREASLSINVLVVGGGVAGLACALGFGRAGHNVIVLEAEDDSYDTAGGARSPPNMTKIIENRWELSEEWNKIAIKSENVSILDYETGEVFGHHRWHEQLMSQTGGAYFLTHHEHLLKLLRDAAKSYGAQIRLNSRVVSVHRGSLKAGIKPSVSLGSGETLSADIIVGADGPDSTVRRLLLGDVDEGEPMGLIMWHTLVPWSALEKDSDLEFFVERKDHLCTFYGNNSAVITFPVMGPSGNHLSVLTWTPDDGVLKDPGRGDWRKQYDIADCVKAMGKCDPRLVKLVKAGRPPTCVRTYNTPVLEDWASGDAPVVLAGEAAHPLPAGSIQQQSMSIGDAAFLSEIFSHLSSYDQIPKFLDAFEEMRRPRTTAICENEVANHRFMTLPPGPAQEARDTIMRKARETGQNVFDGEEAYEAVVKVWTYDAIDEANDWWMGWGVVEERAKGVVSEKLAISVQHVTIV